MSFGRPVNAAPAPRPAAPAGGGLNLRDRRVQLAAGGGLAVAVFALSRRGGGASASDVATGTSGGASTADTTASDLDQAIASAMQDVNSRLDDISQGIHTTTPQQHVDNPPVTTPPTKPVPTNTGPAKPAAKPAARSYTIRSGDTLSAIARRNRTSLAGLKKLNPGLFDSRHRGGNLIKPGERVRLS